MGTQDREAGDPRPSGHEADTVQWLGQALPRRSDVPDGPLTPLGLAHPQPLIHVVNKLCSDYVLSARYCF